MGKGEVTDLQGLHEVTLLTLGPNPGDWKRIILSGLHILKF